MISERMEKALNEQLNKELYSAYLYGAMAAHFESQNLPGFGHWMRIQTQEELAHAIKFYDYILETGGKVTLLAIEQPPSEYGTAEEVFTQVLAHERFVTKCIHELVKLAREEGDLATEFFLHWYVTEQVEEESNADGILQKLKMVAGHTQGVFMMDRELAQRPVPPPAAGTGR